MILQDDHAEIIRTLQSQQAFIKWMISGAAVGLAYAIVALWRRNNKLSDNLRNQGIDHQKLADSHYKLGKTIQTVEESVFPNRDRRAKKERGKP